MISYPGSPGKYWTYNIELAENILMVFFLKYRNIIFSIRTNLWSSLANIMPFGDRSMQNCTFSCDRAPHATPHSRATNTTNAAQVGAGDRDICQQKGKSKLKRFKIGNWWRFSRILGTSIIKSAKRHISPFLLWWRKKLLIPRKKKALITL